MSIVTKRYKRVAFFAELNILISRNRNVLDVRASLKVGLQMEQGNFPFHSMFYLDIEPGSLDKAVVHVGDLMISTSLWVS